MFVLPLSCATASRLRRTALAVACVAAGACYEPRELPQRAAASSCAASCHGDDKSAAPPPGIAFLGAARETTARGVGAHQAHLTARSGLASPLACETCHAVPEDVYAPGHLDPAPAEVALSGLARAKDHAASWDGARCSSYCHGPGTADKTGGQHREPEWTRVDGSQIGCDSCHGFPPRGAHPAAERCDGCHPSAGAGRAIAQPALHIDGVLQVAGGAGSCTSCHGSPESAAPPRDTQGGSDPGARGVGLHQAHVRASALHAPYACSACHVEPTAPGAAGHDDTPLPAEVTFGPLARGELRTPPAALTPTWDASALRCSSVYCHALDGAGVPEVGWTAPQKLVCGSCHGLPPARTLAGADHPPAALSACASCHGSVIDASGKIIAPARHADGKVDR